MNQPFMNQPFNPYQQNIEIVRGFFRKSIVLITAIIFCLPNIFAVIMPFLSFAATLPTIMEAGGDSNYNFSVSFDILAILFALAFFMLFFKSRSRKPYVKLKRAVTLIQVCSIIYAILSAISIAVFIVLTILLLCFSSQMPESVFQTALLLAGIASANSVADFLIYFALCKFTKGIKYSLTSVFLTKKGSIFTVVAGIIYIVVRFLILFLIFYSLNGIMDLIYYAFSLLTQESIDFSLFNDTVLELANATVIINIVDTSIKVLPYVFIAITAFMYNRYIKKATTDLVLTPVENEATRFYNHPQPAAQGAPQPSFNQNGAAPFVPPVQNFRQPPAGNPSEQYVYQNPYSNNTPQNNQYTPQTPPQDFVPQPVFNNTEKTDGSNEPNEKICTFCGTKLPLDTKFCPKCGERL